jgi:uncharacterized membrane protein YeaQ/YmgE (transglycosylase-associated protein family)
MEGILGLIISLISGAVGGNIAGGVLDEHSLGPLGNSLAGIVGGGLGGQLLSALGVTRGTSSHRRANRVTTSLTPVRTEADRLNSI